MSAVSVAANRGDLGGGEIMLMRLAEALAAADVDVTVVAPATPGDLASEAEARGLDVLRIAGRDRLEYAKSLRRWHTGRSELLWCNGLVPAVATAGRPNRVVHLHQLPTRRQRPLARLARWRADAVVVPSDYMRSQLGDDVRVLHNWTDGSLLTAPGSRRAPQADGSVVVGFLGRVGLAKGVDVLANACRDLPPAVRERVELLVAGDDRFMPSQDREVIDTAFRRAGVHIRREGWIDRGDFFAEVDVAVFPSVWGEPFGLVAAEAMEAGCPVIVSDAGALPEVVGVTYPWISTLGDASSLAQVLTEAIERLPATDLTQPLQRRWLDLFSPAAGERSLLHLLREIGLVA